MDDQAQGTQTADNSHLSPAERAVANGYKEPPAPTRQERIATAVHDLEHAIAHNAPVTPAMFAEIKDLLGVNGVGEAAGDQVDPNAKPTAET